MFLCELHARIVFLSLKWENAIDWSWWLVLLPMTICFLLPMCCAGCAATIKNLDDALPMHVEVPALLFFWLFFLPNMISLIILMWTDGSNIYNVVAPFQISYLFTIGELHFCSLYCFVHASEIMLTEL